MLARFARSQWNAPGLQWNASCSLPFPFFLLFPLSPLFFSFFLYNTKDKEQKLNRIRIEMASNKLAKTWSSILFRKSTLHVNTLHSFPVNFLFWIWTLFSTMDRSPSSTHVHFTSTMDRSLSSTQVHLTSTMDRSPSSTQAQLSSPAPWTDHSAPLRLSLAHQHHGHIPQLWIKG